MKVAILGESSADEEATRILVEALMEHEAISVELPALRTRGWPSVLDYIPAVISHLQYHTDAEAFVVVVDSNSCPIFPLEAPLPSSEGERCRLRKVSEAVRGATSRLKAVAGRAVLKTAVGVAVPAIEAWLLCGLDSLVSEQAWLSVLGSRNLPYSKNALKQRVYGTDRPSLEMEKRVMADHARRLAADIAGLERRFPLGFGSLAKDVRGWGP
jgi:hypothetical protein